jgi:NADH-quinone oxidoreductase subunit E
MPEKAEESSLLEDLIEIQNRYGHIEPMGLMAAAERFKVSESQAFGVASFYSRLALRPGGRHRIEVCASAPCHVSGSGNLLDALTNHLGIGVEETSADGEFSLLLTECIGQCQNGPVFAVDGRPVFVTSADEIPLILEAIRKGTQGLD